MNVLVTRPDERGQQLVELLAEQQIFALHQPLCLIEAGSELPLLPSLFSRLNRGDYIFAVSRNAVEFASQTLSQTGFSWRSDLHYFAVGQSTASYFSSQSEQVVHYPISSENSEGLLQLQEMQQLADKQIVILRANTGREFFAEQASLRGANVQILECYRRIMVDNLTDKLGLAKRAGIDTILITSGEMLSILVEQTLESDQKWLKSCRLVVVGKRLARLAMKLGWKSEQIHLSQKADNPSLLEVIVSIR